MTLLKLSRWPGRSRVALPAVGMPVAPPGPPLSACSVTVGCGWVDGYHPFPIGAESAFQALGEQRVVTVAGVAHLAVRRPQVPFTAAVPHRLKHLGHQFGRSVGYGLPANPGRFVTSGFRDDTACPLAGRIRVLYRTSRNRQNRNRTRFSPSGKRALNAGQRWIRRILLYAPNVTTAVAAHVQPQVPSASPSITPIASRPIITARAVGSI